MGQQEVYYFLKENKKSWYTAREISQLTAASLGSVTNNLKKLRQSNQVNFRKEKRPAKPSGQKEVFVYRYKS